MNPSLLQLPVEPFYYKLFNKTDDGRTIKTDTEKSSEVEAKELSENKISDYNIPAFDESKPVGKNIFLIAEKLTILYAVAHCSGDLNMKVEPSKTGNI